MSDRSRFVVPGEDVPPAIAAVLVAIGAMSAFSVTVATGNGWLGLLVAMLMAGLAGMSEIAGVVHRLQSAISPGYGFTGIIIAWLAKLNPLAVVPVAILFGGLILAGREIQPAGVPRLIQGIILFTLIASEVLLRYRVRLVRAGAEE